MQYKPSFTKATNKIKEKAKKSYFEAKIKDPELKNDIEEFEETLDEDYSYYLDLAFNIYSSEYPNQAYIDEMHELFSDPKRKSGFDRYIASINTVINNLSSNPDFYENCNKDDVTNLKTTRKALVDFKEFEHNFVSQKIHKKNTYPSLKPEMFIGKISQQDWFNDEESEKYLSLNKKEQEVYLKKREDVLFKKFADDIEYKSEAQVNGIVKLYQDNFISQTANKQFNIELDKYLSLNDNDKTDYLNNYKDKLITDSKKDPDYTADKFGNISYSADKQIELFLIAARKREQGDKPHTINGPRLRMS